jgi:glutamate racemase
VTAVAATLFVALAEEGWTKGEVAEAVARRYLGPLFTPAAAAPDVLVLGCTHFPPLVDAIRATVGDAVRIVDSAATTADALATLIESRHLASGHVDGSCRFLVTDGEERFARVGPIFLGSAIRPDAIERVDLQVVGA